MDFPSMRPPSSPQSRGSPCSMYSQQQHMTGIEMPHEHDVLCGRGVTTNRHVGNENFRSLVNCNKELYVTSTKRQKMTISRSIVDAVRSLEPPGRFLEKDQHTSLWFDIGDKKAIEKTSQALRDGAASLRKQLSHDLNDPDFLSEIFDMENEGMKEIEGTKPSGKPRLGKVKAPMKLAVKVPAKAPAKGHRRTKSNPCESEDAKEKKTAKKQRSSNIAPMSPREGSYHQSRSINLPSIPRPLQPPMSPPLSYHSRSISHSVPSSPNVRRPHSSSPAGENRPFRHGRFTFDGKSPSKTIAISRSYEQGSGRLSPVASGSSNSKSGECYLPLSPRNSEQEYPRQMPPRPLNLGPSHHNPNGYNPPHPAPASPRPSRSSQMQLDHPMSPPPPGPLQPGIHRLSPAGYQASPTVQWSPRRIGPHPNSCPHPGSGYGRPSPSPHPYQYPSDHGTYGPPDYSNYPHRRRPPDRRPYISPRYSAYEDDYYGSSNHLSVPQLGNGDQHMMASPVGSGYYRGGTPPPGPYPPGPPMPSSPHYHHSRSQERNPYCHVRPRSSMPPPTPSDFTPPPPSSRSPRHHSTPERVLSSNFPRSSTPPFYPRKKNDLSPASAASRHEDQEEKKSDDNSNGGESREMLLKQEFPQESPSGVEIVLSLSDVGCRNTASSRILESPALSLDAITHDNPAEGDRMSVSPLPFESERCDFDEEDPDSLLEVPDDILTLPISPCGPNDIRSD